MKRLVITIMLLALIIAPMQAYQVRNVSNGINYSITEEEKGLVNRSVMMSNVSWVMLLGNLVSLPVIFLVNPPEIGGILAVLALGGWTITQGFAALPLRDMKTSVEETGSTVPDCDVPMWSHIMAASFGMGGIVGAGLIFSDDTGAAIALTAVCCVISWISGIIGNFGSYAYASSISRIPYNTSYNQMYFPEMNNANDFNDKGLSINIPIYNLTF